MFLVINWNATLIVVACALGIYYWWLLRTGILKTNQPAPIAEPPIVEDIIPLHALQTNQAPMFLPPAVDRFPDPEEEAFLELLDQKEGILLREAERIVDEIQLTIDHIASSPANPEEVTSKIRAIVEPFHIFLETEYYDSINTYIALAVERDCNIKLSQQQLQELWN